MQYVYTRQRRDLDVDGRKIYVVLAQSISAPQFPEKSGVIRVKQYKQSLAIESDGKKGSRGKAFGAGQQLSQCHLSGRQLRSKSLSSECNHGPGTKEA